MNTKKLSLFFLIALLTGCANNTSSPTYEAGKINDPLKIMEAKREYYKELDIKAQKEKEEQERLEQEKLKQEQEAKVIGEENIVTDEVKKDGKNVAEIVVEEGYQKTAEGTLEEVAQEEIIDGKVIEASGEESLVDPEKEEQEKVANMTPNEKLLYQVDKAKAKIDAMDEIAKKARQEEIDNAQAITDIKEALKKDSAE